MYEIARASTVAPQARIKDQIKGLSLRLGKSFR